MAEGSTYAQTQGMMAKLINNNIYLLESILCHTPLSNKPEIPGMMAKLVMKCIHLHDSIMCKPWQWTLDNQWLNQCQAIPRPRIWWQQWPHSAPISMTRSCMTPVRERPLIAPMSNKMRYDGKIDHIVLRSAAHIHREVGCNGGYTVPRPGSCITTLQLYKLQLICTSLVRVSRKVGRFFNILGYI